MKYLKTFTVLTMFFVMLTSFTQCSSSKTINDLKHDQQVLKLEEDASFTLSDTYFQSWVSGVKGGGSGIHMYINVITISNNVLFDSVYFRGLKAKVEISKMGYIASFTTKANQKQDIVMSNNKNAEYGNQIPTKQDFPFELKDNEAVISYWENATSKYLLIKNIKEKSKIEYPSAPPRR
ncbi:hypothetical protein [Lacinutrix algicola]|uniref:hypothetical protein n=1 Tax=Lacinutrix algicola TaxID=342954 RepID=UPI000A698EA4|nr:hypothetical protein [Lacinutrix algicola]